MKNSVLETMLKLVKGDLPDVMVGSGIKMDALKFRSIGVLPEIVRPLGFAYEKADSEKEVLERDARDSFFESLASPEDLCGFLDKIGKAGGVALKERALERLFWEGACLSVPNVFDYGEDTLVTDDWRIVVPRMTPEPRYALFARGDLPMSFFKILRKVLVGHIQWDGEPPLPVVAGPMRIVGKLEETYARQIFIFNSLLVRFERRLMAEFRRGDTLEELYERVTMAEAKRYKNRIMRVQSQQLVLEVMLAEHVQQILPDASSNFVMVCRGWDLAVPI